MNTPGNSESDLRKLPPLPFSVSPAIRMKQAMGAGAAAEARLQAALEDIARHCGQIIKRGRVTEDAGKDARNPGAG